MRNRLPLPEWETKQTPTFPIKTINCFFSVSVALPKLADASQIFPLLAKTLLIVCWKTELRHKYIRAGADLVGVDCFQQF